MTAAPNATAIMGPRELFGEELGASASPSCDLSSSCFISILTSLIYRDQTQMRPPTHLRFTAKQEAAQASVTLRIGRLSGSCSWRSPRFVVVPQRRLATTMLNIKTKNAKVIGRRQFEKITDKRPRLFSGRISAALTVLAY